MTRPGEVPGRHYPPITSGPCSWHGCALSPLQPVAIVPIGSDVVPPQEGTQPIHLGVRYADDAFVLCGNWICGGPLDIPAAGSAGSGSGYSFSIVGPFVEICPGFGRAPRCAFHFVIARPFQPQTEGRLLKCPVVISAFHSLLNTIGSSGVRDSLIRDPVLASCGAPCRIV